MVKLLSDRAPAKINLFLRVTAQRNDGYHELDSVFVPISIFDRLDIEIRPSNSPVVRLISDSEIVPSGEGNLAFRAARDFLTEFGIQAEVLIRLHKEIPLGAGLGGGSSDAGTVLRIMAALCRINDPARLLTVAIGLGADVPFFLNPTPAHVRGIGEQCDPLGHIAKLFLLIAVPPVVVSTASVYRDLRREHWSGLAPPGDISAIIEGRISHEHLVNDLEQAALARWPEIGETKKLVEAAGAQAAAMTGSGGAVFGIFNSSEEAGRASQEIRNRAPYLRTFTASAL
jgi:4-diphosphocytidyl-2-C-methyl-D-erythritol kinase